MSGEDDRARVDAAIGERIRRRRVALGLTQEQLACKLGLSFQQIQKHERGANRISASRLYALARRLDVAPGFFFADLEIANEGVDDGGDGRLASEVARRRPRRGRGRADRGGGAVAGRRGTAALTRGSRTWTRK